MRKNAVILLVFASLAIIGYVFLKDVTKKPTEPTEIRVSTMTRESYMTDDKDISFVLNWIKESSVIIKPPNPPGTVIATTYPYFLDYKVGSDEYKYSITHDSLIHYKNKEQVESYKLTDEMYDEIMEVIRKLKFSYM